MALSADTRFGDYQIGEVIGQGGMGQVYRATDTTLERDVAIKVLPESFAADQDRLARFEREAKTLASLNHPNIAQIYGLEKHDGVSAIVMELVEGPTLDERIVDGPLEAEEAMHIAMQLIEGLEAAHERGIVHRDLKPANIKIKEDGLVKILDFGIAKAIDPLDSNSGRSPMLTTPAVTQAGIIMGTAAYMSPEQARGKFVDQRTDVWAFGCVLFEMLTGQPAFLGEDIAETLARVIANQTDMDSVPATISPLVRHALAMCLEKDPYKRIRHIGDVKLAIQGDFEIGIGQAEDSSSRFGRIGLAAGLALAVIASTAAWVLKPVPVPEPEPVVRFEIELAEDIALRNNSRDVLDISRDGRQILYNTSQGVFVRDLADRTDRLLPGTVSPVVNPQFSPDAQWVSFWDGQFKKLPSAGGSAVVLSDLDNPQGASWQDDGSRILTADGVQIVAIPANGGQPEILVTLDAGFPWDPQMLPNGDILFTRRGVAEWTIEVWRAATNDVLSLFPGERAIYVSTGHLIVTDPVAAPNALFARTIDLDTYEFGGPVPIAEDIRLNNQRSHFAISPAGHLVSFFGSTGTVGGGSIPDLNLTLVDRNGERRPLAAPPRPYRSPRISPDGSQLAVEIRSEDDTTSSIWIYDLSEDTDIRRLTQVTEGNNLRPIWTLDGQQIAFMSDRDGPGSMYLQPADGSAPAVRLTTADDGTFHLPESWAPDGTLSFALLTSNFGANAWGIYTLAPDGQIAQFHSLNTSNQFGSTFSPDGQWLAYSSGEDSTDAGQFRLYVERFPKSGERYEVAVNGAFFPVFSPDGSEIFYRRGFNDQSRVLNSVSILPSDAGFRFSSADIVNISGFVNHANYRDYDPLPDGSGWILLTPLDGETESADAPGSFQEDLTINVVLNWFEEVRERVQ